MTRSVLFIWAQTDGRTDRNTIAYSALACNAPRDKKTNKI